jgi:hypothetical protein
MIVVADTGPVNYFVNLAEAVSKLRSTGIFLSEEIVQDALKRHQDRHMSDPGKL